MNPFLDIPKKLKILQTGNTLKDQVFTMIWTVVGMILPASMIFLSKDKLIAASKTDVIQMTHEIWDLLIKPLHVLLLVPAVCMIGKFNPQLTKTDIPKYFPARSVFLMLVFCAMWILYTKDMVEMNKICSNTESCFPLVIEILFKTQTCLYRSVSVALVGICSGQVIGRMEEGIDKATLFSQTNIFKQTKQSLSALLFVYLSFEIIDCIIKTNALLASMEIEGGIRVAYVYSLVIYFCLALDDCYVAFKEHISRLRYLN